MSVQVRGRALQLATPRVIFDTLLVSVFALLMIPAARAQVEADPVPYTLQLLFVLLTGLLLGPWRGAAAMALYAAIGFAGAPVFARGGGPEYFLGPSAGYIYGFVAGGLRHWLAGAVARWFLGTWCSQLTKRGGAVPAGRGFGRHRGHTSHLLLWRQSPRPVLSAGDRPGQSLGSSLGGRSGAVHLVRRAEGGHRCGNCEQRRTTKRGNTWRRLTG